MKNYSSITLTPPVETFIKHSFWKRDRQKYCHDVGNCEIDVFILFSYWSQFIVTGSVWESWSFLCDKSFTAVTYFVIELKLNNSKFLNINLSRHCLHFRLIEIISFFFLPRSYIKFADVDQFTGFFLAAIKLILSQNGKWQRKIIVRVSKSISKFFFSDYFVIVSPFFSFFI